MIFLKLQAVILQKIVISSFHNYHRENLKSYRVKVTAKEHKTGYLINTQALLKLLFLF
jgi:hypothetical protein